MIHKSAIFSSKTYPSGYKTPHRGIGSVFLQKDSDILTLKTATETLVIQAPGHSFKNGDEVIFERINNTFFLAKNTNSEIKGAIPTDSDIYFKQNIIETLPPSEILQAICTSIENNLENTSLTRKYIQQLAVIIETVPTTEQSKELRELLNTLKKSNIQPSPEQLKKLLDLVSKLQISAPQSGEDQIYQTRLLAILEKEITEGIYQFNSIDSALQFLDCKESSDITKYLKNLFENDGCVSIRVYTAGEKSSCAQLLNNSILSHELVSLLKKNAPGILDTLPISLFQNFIKETGHLETSMIKLLSRMSIPQNDTPYQSNLTLKKSSDAVLLHWLLTVNECRECADQLAKRIPSGSLATVNEVLSNIPQKNESHTLSLDDIGINASKSFNEKASTMFANRIKTLGFTLEHDLLTGTPSTPTLKSELLNAISASQSNDFKSVISLSSDMLQRKENATISKSLLKLQYLVTQLKNTQLDLSSFSNSVKTPTDTIEQTIKTTINDLINSFTEIKTSTGTSIFQNSIQSSEQFAQVPQSTERPAIHSNQPILLTTVINCIYSLTTLLKATEEFPGLEAFRNIILELQSEFKSIVPSLESKNIFSKTVSENLPIEKSSITSLNQNLTEHTEILEKFQPILKEVLFSSGQDQKPIEVLLHRLESLQLLSRPVVTQDGSGHILSLPVKIGQEWTEVTIRMIKKENSGNSASPSQKRYTVYLDVAPSQLGAVHAMLSYKKSHPLSIKMEFENKEVTSWFSSNLENLRNTLNDKNLHVVNIDFKTMIPIVESTKKDDVSNSKNNIDIKI